MALLLLFLGEGLLLILFLGGDFSRIGDDGIVNVAANLADSISCCLYTTVDLSMKFLCLFNSLFILFLRDCVCFPLSFTFGKLLV